MEHAHNTEDRRVNMRLQVDEGVHNSLRIAAAVRGMPLYVFVEEVLSEAYPARDDWQQLPLFEPRARTVLRKGDDE